MFYTKNLRTNNEIKHCFFSRNNGTSKGIYKSLNCGIGSKDSKDNIQNNLNLVSKEFNIKKSNLILMNQTHSNKVEVINKITNVARINCDAMLTKNNDIALCVLTADCVPILVFERNKKIIGCIHAGWKGAINGIIENFLKRIIEMGGNLKELVVSIGPCIAKQSYEVKKDFYLEFIKRSHHNESFFSNNVGKTYNFDLRGFVTKKFEEFGINEIENVFLDTFSSNNDYFSHRRAKKLGHDDYGRCISVIKKIPFQN